MNAPATIEAYYEALRTGEPLEVYFADDDSATGDITIVKFGVGDAHFGSDAVSEALQEQTDTTEEWTVESADLQVTERDNVAWFADRVTLAWTDMTTGIRRRFETRWSGTLLLTQTDDGERWRFVSMHVSAPRES